MSVNKGKMAIFKATLILRLFSLWRQQTPRPATEPRNPETPKVHSKVRKNAILICKSLGHLQSRKTPNYPENRREIGEKLENPIFCLFFANFSPIFWISGFFYSVDGQGFANFGPPPGKMAPKVS